MSIFKETIAETIQTQLQARTLVVGGTGSASNLGNLTNNSRSQLLPFYLSKNSWVRMTSFTNFDEGTVRPDTKGGFTVDTNRGNYKGDQLSKKYILEGGTLFTRNNATTGSLRYGIATPNAAYGGNIDLAGTTADEYFRTFGIRPMPGITDVSMRTVSAYGSLYETTIKFYAWDTHQLNELEVLFMRPGYSVLLEWGWSQYLDYQNDSASINLTQGQVYPSVFQGGTINPFDTSLTVQTVYDKLEANRKKYKHNYDGMLGYVKNFSWKMNKNGGYECTTTLISMGEVINTLKMSSNVNKLGNLPTVTADPTSTYVFDDYENILLSLKSEIEIYDSSTLKRKALYDNTYRGSWNYDTNYVSKSTIKDKLISKGHTDQAKYLDTQPLYQIIEPDEQQTDGTVYEYISLDVWIAIVESYFNINTPKGVSVKMVIPNQESTCLACKDSVSVDPRVCQIKNQGAFKQEMSFLKYYGNYDPKVEGINPFLYYYIDGKRKVFTEPSWNFYQASRGVGRIDNIFVNIDCLLSTYKEIRNNANEEGVIMNDYIKSVLNKISNSLGGLNNFSISTAGRDQNRWQIIDLYYLEDPSNTKAINKYEFDLMGLGSICRDVDIESQIFQEQSTIVAIAAQSRANLANVYNSSQVYLNAGLQDRLQESKWQGDEIQPLQGNSNDVFYAKLLNFMIYARDYLIGVQTPTQEDKDYYKIYTTNEGGGNSSLLKQFTMKYNGELNFKALIPFKLKITLDGIGGIVVGQIFRVKKNILPKNYYDKNLGFIVTRIYHDLKNNDWTTTLETQICILDQDRQLFKEFIDVQRDGFGDFVEKIAVRGILYAILVDFIEYQMSRSLVGFVRAATKYSSLGDTEAANELIYDYVYDDYNDDNLLTDYWKNNINAIMYDNTGTTGGFRLDQFQNFVQAYAQAQLDIYGNGMEVTSFFGTKTEKEVFEWMANQFWITNTADSDYQEFVADVQKIQAVINNNTQWFYPDPGNKTNINSLYTDNNGNFDPQNKSLFKQYYVPNAELEIFGFDRAELRTRIDRVISNNPTTNAIKGYYYSGIAFPTGGTLPSRYRAQSDGTLVMYGNTKSVGHQYVTSTVNGPLSLSNRQPTGTNASTITRYANAVDILTAFAGTIDWTKVKVRNGSLVPIDTNLIAPY